MWWIILLTIIVIIMLEIVITRYTVRNKFDEYMKNMPESEYIAISVILMIVLFLIRSSIFVHFDWLDINPLCIFVSIGILNIYLCIKIPKLLVAKHFKKKNYSLDGLKRRVMIEKKEEEIRRNKPSKLGILLGIVSGINESNDKRAKDKLEKEMDYNYLNDYEKELVRKGDYDPTNFEYPENEEPLDEDDFYSDDESWK